MKQMMYNTQTIRMRNQWNSNWMCNWHTNHLFNHRHNVLTRVFSENEEEIRIIDEWQEYREPNKKKSKTFVASCAKRFFCFIICINQFNYEPFIRFMAIKRREIFCCSFFKFIFLFFLLKNLITYFFSSN